MIAKVSGCDSVCTLYKVLRFFDKECTYIFLFAMKDEICILQDIGQFVFELLSIIERANC